MDLSYLLVKITRFLVKYRIHDAAAFVHPPDCQSLNRWIISLNIQAKKNSEIFRSSGNAISLHAAYMRALGELCEVICMHQDGFFDRSGMAAGLSREEIISRAKCELLERDSFLYHYRNKIPFLSTERIANKLLAFELSSADRNVYIQLVTDMRTVRGQAKCIKFGIGAALSRRVATEKALQEFSNINLNHELFPEKCEEWANGLAEIPTIMDRHHTASRDPRNLELFEHLFKVHKSDRSEINREMWRVSKLKSPIRFLKIFKVIHPQLTSLNFGVPEKGTTDLLHPFW